MPPNRLRLPIAGGLALLAGAAPGCRSYRPEPLDLEAHRAAWEGRDPAGPEVAAFARRLAPAEAEAPGGDLLADGLSLREAEAVALVYNPDLRVERARAGVTLAGSRFAGLWDDPVLGVDLERIIQDVEHRWALGSTLSFTVPISGRLAAEKARAGAEHEAQLRRIVASEWDTRVALRRAWVEWSAAELRAATTRELLERLEPLLPIVGRLEEAGELSRAEGRLFRVERASRTAELIEFEAASARLELEIRSVLGLTPDAPVTLRPELAAPAADAADHGAGALRERLAGTNPRLAVARAEYEVAERALRREVRAQYPDLTIGPGYGTEEGDDRVLLGVSLPIPLINRNRGGVARAEAEREVARAAFETTYERLVSAAAIAELDAEAARRRRETIESQVVPLVDEQYAEGRRLAELGEVDTLLLLETLTRQHAARLALVEAAAAEALARSRIQELLGPPPEAADPSLATPDSRAPTEVNP